jgi:beta-lactamase superfamily II metal-dependent hydrolase
MPSALETTASSSDLPPLDLHVIGAGKGESVVLRLPDGSWGVVDCYASVPDDPDTNPTAVFLRQQGVKTLDFVCLTHPHDDHFVGMARLIDEFRPREFWRFGALSPAHIRTYLAYLQLRAKAAHSEELGRSAYELMCVFERAYRGAKAKTLRTARLTSRSVLRDTRVGDPEHGPRLRVECLAPSGNQVEAYERAVLSCVESDGRRVKGRLPHSAHNRVSVVLRVTYGQTRLVLGGDLEAAGWHDVVEEHGEGGLSASAVKVSHHGSENGYCDGLWGRFAAERPPIAVVTPYYRFHLPEPEALSHIAVHAASVYTTCPTTPGTPERTARRRRAPQPQAAAPIESRLAVRHTFAARILPAAAPRACQCTFRFDPQGHCLGPEIEHPGFRL